MCKQSVGFGMMKTNHQNVLFVYFSATGITETYVSFMERVFVDQGWEVARMNVTSYSSRQKPLILDNYKNVIFGFPVYSDFAPGVINDWLPTLSGQGRRCGMFFTYGGRTCGYAHFHTKQLLEKAGFQTLFSAEFLGRHSFNLGGFSMVPDRPNQIDFEVSREYVELAIDRFTRQDPPNFRLQKPFGYSTSLSRLEHNRVRTYRGAAQPTRVTGDCQMCRLCEDECPTMAFDAETGLSDIEKCIECMRCVLVCPDQVIKCDQKMKQDFPAFLEHFHLTREMMNAKRSKIITEPWQAAA